VNVLCISTDYPPHDSGGYEQQCRDTVDAMRRDGHRVLVLSGELRQAAADASCGVRRELPRFPVRPRPVEACDAWRAELRAGVTLRRSLLDFRPDVVCLWRLGELSMSLPARAAGAGVPVVGVVCDTWMLDGPLRDPWARAIGARPIDAGRWLFVSEALRRQVLEAGVAVADADIVAAGVDLAAFSLAPARQWSGRLLYAGRLSPLKGVDIAIRALALLPSTCTLDVAGSGPPAYERQLRDLVERLGIAARVRFRGMMTRRRLGVAYQSSDAVLFPVRWAEPFGLVPLEAMACGATVIAVASGGAATYLRDGDTALLVPPEDAAAIAAAVNRLASQPALREQLRRGGRRAAEQYPAERSQATIQAALEEAVGRCRARPDGKISVRPPVRQPTVALKTVSAAASQVLATRSAASRSSARMRPAAATVSSSPARRATRASSS